MKQYIVLLALLLSANLPAQPHKNPPTPAELHAKKWDYLVTAAQLTPDEAEAVRPIYMAHEESMWELHKKHRPTRKKVMTTADYEDMNERYIQREVKQAELLQAYHLQLKEVLSPETLHNYYKAEHDHKRQLIYDMQNHHRLKTQKDTPN